MQNPHCWWQQHEPGDDGDEPVLVNGVHGLTADGHECGEIPKQSAFQQNRCGGRLIDSLFRFTGSWGGLAQLDGKIGLSQCGFIATGFANHGN